MVNASVTRLVALGLLLVALLAAVGWVGYSYLDADEVRLPDVKGMNVDLASAALRELGLEPRGFPEVDPNAAPNQVLSQSPAAGQWVRPGRQVSLGVNALSEVRVAPALVGLSETEAVNRATGVGVVIDRVLYQPSDRPLGSVVRQEPASGTALPIGQGVELVVSRGLVDAPLTLPDLSGQPLDQAVAALEALGVRQVERLAADLSFDRPGTVTGQRPAAGSQVSPSTPVTLMYSLEGAQVVAVPDLLGQPLWQAQLSLRGAQLMVGAIRRVQDPNLPEGVVEVLPQGYTLVGSPVALTINGGADPLDLGWFGLPDRDPGPNQPSDPLVFADPGRDPGPTIDDDDTEADAVPAPGTTALQEDGSRVIPFRFDPANVGVASLLREPYRLTVVVADAEGERTVFDRQQAAGESVEMPVRIVGDEPLLQTYINGSFFQAWRP